MTEAIVHEDFLDKKDFEYVKKNIIDNMFFPWYYQQHKVTVGDNKVQFTHVFYEKHSKNSDHYKFLEPILNKLNPSAIRRIKANMTHRSNDIKTFDFHTDFQGNFENQKTGIFYMNTNNGKTVFETGEEVDSIENRLLVFPAHLKHTGTTHTDDTQMRCVINFNWY